MARRRDDARLRDSSEIRKVQSERRLELQLRRRLWASNQNRCCNARPAMTAARIHVHRTPMPRLISVYLNFLCFVLAGYVVLGRAFAYLGFPPLYIGEMTLVLGIVAALLAGNLTGAIF